ncbi:MAG TPA: hypothetical protein VK424_01815 [Thermoplasmata archaeon]|nr:hypothetical protein [Thermoplasmata archaeon]
MKVHSDSTAAESHTLHFQSQALFPTLFPRQGYATAGADHPVPR